MQNFDSKTFQGMIWILQDYWAHKGCTIIQPLDIEVGAGTSHPITFFRALGPEPFAAAYVQPARRPTDGRYGNNPNRLQHYYQFKVMMKPSPQNIQELYLESLKAVGLDTPIHDVRFVEDNWENPTLGAWGLGWEVWLNGMEVTQFTYFQKMGGLECSPITGEITYGLERLALYLQDKDSIYDLIWNNSRLCYTNYGDIFYQNECEQSTYNFEYAYVDFLFHCFDQYEKESKMLLSFKKPLPFPAYEKILKAVHIFNVLEARKAISVTECQCYILRIRNLSTKAAKAYCNSREVLGFPLCKKNKRPL